MGSLSSCTVTAHCRGGVPFDGANVKDTPRGTGSRLRIFMHKLAKYLHRHALWADAHTLRRRQSHLDRFVCCCFLKIRLDFSPDII
jgi:hypothetical protein